MYFIFLFYYILRGSMKSLNTGIVTLLNYGKHVPPAVSHVTLAHEIGHNFGSPHDPEICTPGGDDGNYIMFARATSGDKKNNNKWVKWWKISSFHQPRLPRRLLWNYLTFFKRFKKFQIFSDAHLAHQYGEMVI